MVDLSIRRPRGAVEERFLSKVVLSLFVTGHTPSSERAMVNLRRICDNRINGHCEIRVFDVLENPRQAEEMRILATPTLIREAPQPPRRVIGDLSDMEKVFQALSLHELQSSEATRNAHG
jgi:circadian clock protein KaiB